jgi:tRNA threonylcarbamoyladenosine biosynthesis protein TsaE
MDSVVLNSEDELIQLACKIGTVLQPGDVLLLEGGLGVGKTTFTRHLIQGLGYTESVTSPTFRILHRYDTVKGPIFHADLYRLSHENEVHHLDIEAIFREKKGVLIVEWADLFPALWPLTAYKVRLDFNPEGGAGSRRMGLSGFQTL